MQTEDLIRALAADAAPVKRLPRPGRRTVTWFAISIVYIGVVVLLMGLRPDIATKLTQPRFLIEVGAAFLTSMTAAAAAFCAASPGRPMWERLAPLPFLAIWLASLGEGCWRDWLTSDGLGLQLDFLCFPTIVAISIAPAVLIFVMLRRGAPIAPAATTTLATLAAAALAAAGLRLFHPQDASVMVLVWEFGSVAVLAGAGALLGRHLMTWPSPRTTRTCR